jgi:hypothetical protein
MKGLHKGGAFRESNLAPRVSPHLNMTRSRHSLCKQSEQTASGRKTGGRDFEFDGGCNTVSVYKINVFFIDQVCYVQRDRPYFLLMKKRG